MSVYWLKHFVIRYLNITSPFPFPPCTMITLVYKTALNLSRGKSNLKMKCSVVLPWSYALAWFLTWGINCTRFCQEHSSSDRPYEMNLSFQASSLCNLREMGNGARQAGSCIPGLPGYRWLRNPFLPLPSPPFLSLFLCSQAFRSLLSSRNPILPSTNAHWLFCDQSLYGHGSVLCRHCRQGFHGAFSQQPAFCDSHGFRVTQFPAAIWPPTP